MKAFFKLCMQNKSNFLPTKAKVIVKIPPVCILFYAQWFMRGKY